LKKPAKVGKNKAALPNEYKKAEKNLADILDLKVEIKTSGNGKKGKLVLDFKNEEQLQHILSYFNG